MQLSYESSHDLSQAEEERNRNPFDDEYESNISYQN